MFSFSPYTNPRTPYGYGYASAPNPYYAYSPYTTPHDAEARSRQARQQALLRAQQQRQREQQQREAYARAIAQQRARKQPARRPSDSIYDPAEDEDWLSDGLSDPYDQRRRELEDARRIEAMYRRRPGAPSQVKATGVVDDQDQDEDDEVDEMEVDEPKRTAPAQRITIPIRSPSPPAHTKREPAITPHLSPPPSPHTVSAAVAATTTSPSLFAAQIQTEPILSQTSSIPPQTAHKAATRIARAYRRYVALRTLRNLSARFDTLKLSFVPPYVLDYTLRADVQEHVVSVDTSNTPFPSPTDTDTISTPASDVPEGEKAPLLAYTTHTTPVHAHTEALLRLLNDLDAVPSWGDRMVRNVRRDLARRVEGEAARLDEWVRAVWRARSDQGSEAAPDNAPSPAH